MKSIANQYRDLKEGRMSQFNFMRNLRMSMPQYITNTTSFKDAVRILKNKSILTEMSYNPGLEPSSREDQSGMELSDDFYDAIERGIDRYGKYTPGYKDLFKFFINLEPENYINAETPDEAIDIIINLFDDENAKLDDMISKGEDELSPDMYKFNDFEGGLSEGKKKKTKKEEKPYNPNAIHPSELRMGIRVEMEHTDDPKKAEKIALDHLAENPFYYTALKLSGVESPSAPKAPAPKKIKKKDATEMVDQANQMQKVKLMKEALEKLIREELSKKKLNEGNNTIPLGITKSQIKSMRSWLKDIDWADMEPEDIDDISDNKVINAVIDNYDGGLKAFFKDNKKTKIKK